MKYSYFSLLLTIACFCTLECASAQNQGSDHFQLPNELSVQYLNVSEEEIKRSCDRLGRCLTEKNNIIRDVTYNAGLRMIDQFPNIMRNRSSVTDADWDTLIDHRCLVNIPMNMMVSISNEIAWTCILRDRHVPKDNIQRYHREWVKEYCARVRRLALRQYQENENRH
ncbi:uncharacterized protein LOC122500252 [Leptopilina heterotoma]|uniref:uncharacterized protein LOC122500252 n=1 Tax=Leptopilina heterotoma TaxID=63436 RepID=UPI001CA83F54|nr:uncharacterized protein LOC122500252 [Leptopilina heterotoma]